MVSKRQQKGIALPYKYIPTNQNDSKLQGIYQRRKTVFKHGFKLKSVATDSPCRCLVTRVAVENVHLESVREQVRST